MLDEPDYAENLHGLSSTPLAYSISAISVHPAPCSQQPPKPVQKRPKDIHRWFLAPNSLTSGQLWKCKLYVPSQFQIFLESADLRSVSFVFATIFSDLLPKLMMTLVTVDKVLCFAELKQRVTQISPINKEISVRSAECMHPGSLCIGSKPGLGQGGPTARPRPAAGPTLQCTVVLDEYKRYYYVSSNITSHTQTSSHLTVDYPIVLSSMLYPSVRVL